MTQTEPAPATGGDQASSSQAKGPMHEEMKAINAIMRKLTDLPSNAARQRAWSYVTAWLAESANAQSPVRLDDVAVDEP